MVDAPIDDALIVAQHVQLFAVVGFHLKHLPRERFGEAGNLRVLGDLHEYRRGAALAIGLAHGENVVAKPGGAIQNLDRGRLLRGNLPAGVLLEEAPKAHSVAEGEGRARENQCQRRGDQCRRAQPNASALPLRGGAQRALQRIVKGSRGLGYDVIKSILHVQISPFI